MRVAREKREERREKRAESREKRAESRKRHVLTNEGSSAQGRSSVAHQRPL
jgi:hypothetical protein